ncbi:hypothetical protein [Frigidibacter sp.]|uniref:hypothetical protein n=1 Tax=Frigidibacter sp. TaxID=2586418 RepID=UPI00273490C3|nr:hypothetical protein [Frigidibacter sp.]MDP3341886.1 hypothetical protein [Frigidibacter sp.]
MKHLFRRPDSGLSGYAALALFAAAYLAVIAVVIAPDAVKSAFDASAHRTFD